MRKILFSCLIIFSIASAAEVRLSIVDGIDNTAVKSKMENTASALLTEINNAQAEGRNLNLASLNLPQSVQISLSMLWENSPFICTQNAISQHGLTTATGYQVRNIPLQMKPRADRQFGEDEQQEAVISFNQQGIMQSFYISLGMNQYMKVVNAHKDVTDLRRRQLILDWTERFRTAYNTKDIHFLDQVFSEDALIITGQVIKQKKSDVQLPDKIKYTVQNKQEYLTRLKNVFAKNSYIKVTFDDISVKRHPNPHYSDFYGVTLHQGWTSGTYHDDGYLFLLWDFRNEDQPQIHVRTWQPDQLNGQPIDEDDVFQVDDFTLE